MKQSLRTGTNLDDRYEIIRVLGMGGFGITYEAENIRIHQRVAIKELFCPDYMQREVNGIEVGIKSGPDRTHQLSPYRKQRWEADKASFLRESRIVSTFENEPGIVHVLDYFEANGTAYIVMEFLDGLTLHEKERQQGVFEPDDIFERMMPVMETLSKIHKAGVLHGDISPDNIMIQKDGSLKLIDFGAAAVIQRGKSDGIDTAMSEMVTDGYTALEQYIHELPSSEKKGPWTDIYSLAATIYTCITGVVPFPAVMRSAYDELKKPSEFGIHIHPRLERILMKAMAVKPQERFQSMEEFHDSVLTVLNIRKKKLGRRLFWKRAFCAAGAAAAFAVMIYAGTHKSKLKFIGQRTDMIWVSKPENMSKKDFSNNNKILQKRLDVLAGKKNYLWEENGSGEEITITFPSRIRGTASLKETAEQYLTASWKSDITEKCIFEDGSYVWSTPVYKIGAGDLSAFRIEQEHSSKKDKKAIYEGTILNRMRRALLETRSSKLFLEQSDTLWNPVLDQEKNPIHLKKGEVQVDLSKVPEMLQKLVLFELATEPMTEGLNCDEKEKTSWENPNQSILSGEYEKKASEIKKDPVILKYVRQFPKAGKLSSGERVGSEAVLRERLDGIQKPYAIGSETGDQNIILVKMERGDIMASVAEILAHNSLYTKADKNAKAQYIPWLAKELAASSIKGDRKLDKNLTDLMKVMEKEDMPTELSFEGAFEVLSDGSIGPETSLKKGQFNWQECFQDCQKMGEDLGGKTEIHAESFDDPHLLIRFSDMNEESMVDRAADTIEKFVKKACSGKWTLNNGEIDLYFSEETAKSNSIYVRIRKKGKTEEKDAKASASIKDSDASFECRITVQNWKESILESELKDLLNRSNLKNIADWNITTVNYGRDNQE